MATLSGLAERAIRARRPNEACAEAIVALSMNPYDLRFVLIYLLARDGASVGLCGTAGIPATGRRRLVSARRMRRATGSSGRWRPCSGKARRCSWKTCRQGRSRPPLGPHQPAARRARASPHALERGHPGRHRRRRSAHGCDSTTGTGGSSSSWPPRSPPGSPVLRAYEETHQRAERLAEIDRAKSIFYRNISHEFARP